MANTAHICKDCIKIYNLHYRYYFWMIDNTIKYEFGQL